MTTPVMKIKIIPKSVIQGKMDVRFPANVSGQAFVRIEKQAGSYTILPDYAQLGELYAFDPARQTIAVQDSVTGSWSKLAIGDMLSNAAVTVRVVTEAGDIVVGPSVQLLVMNRATDEGPSNVILPASSAKVGKLKIVDFKGNASLYPHTISLQGADEFQGGLTEWMLSGDGASVVLDPIPGIGYAV